ncbi:MAG TPA: hypothetical protein VK797_20225 [Tepidisphaeraceae bacterium]|nr:hypothetical protein [Tepidisphaeraceae bacterium]
MPAPGKKWRHVIINTRSSWLHGDERGFRNRGHRIHLKIKAIVGDAKRKASRAVKRELPGTIWAAGGTYKRVKSRQHQRSAYNYILYDQGRSAWTWSFKDAAPEGCTGRKRP